MVSAAGDPDCVTAELQDPTTLVVRGGEAVWQWREDHAVPVPGARFTPQYKSGRWDGLQRFGSLRRFKDGTFRLSVGRGLLDLFRKSFPDVKVSRREKAPEIILGFPEGLRDFQENALRTIAEKKWGRIAFATNAGKGAVIALVARSAEACGMRALILADEISVFDALRGEFKEWTGGEPDLVESGTRKPPEGDVVLAMVPTLARRIDPPKAATAEWKGVTRWQDWLSDFDMVLLDEADRSAAARWKKVLRVLRWTHYRFGFSGSFDTISAEVEQILLESMGPIRHKIRNIELVERGISAQPFVELVPFVQDLPFVEAYRWFEMTGPERRLWVWEQGIVYNDARHQHVLSLLDPEEQNAIVVNRVDHGFALVDVIPDSVFLSGKDSKEVRQRTLFAFRRGEFQNLIVTKILDRGTNMLGTVVGLIFASGEGSSTQTLQRIGRGLRRAGGKEFLFLVDIIDRPPPDYREPTRGPKPYKYLASAASKRIRLYNREGFEVSIRQ